MVNETDVVVRFSKSGTKSCTVSLGVAQPDLIVAVNAAVGKLWIVVENISVVTVDLVSEALVVALLIAVDFRVVDSCALVPINDAHATSSNNLNTLLIAISGCFQKSSPIVENTSYSTNKQNHNNTL